MLPHGPDGTPAARSEQQGDHLEVASVGIVAVAYRQTDAELSRYLDQIRRLSYPATLSYTVSNEPTRRLDFLKRDGNQVVDASLNLGFAGGANMGIAAALEAGASHVLVLNTDVDLMATDLIEKLLNALEDGSHAAAVSPVILQGDRRGTTWYRGARVGHWWWGSHYPGLGRRYQPPLDPEPERTGAFCGCCVLFSAEFLREVGGFDEDLFCYFEEAELSLRAHRSGWEVRLWPEPLLTHLKSGRRLGEVEAYYFARNPLLVMGKHAQRRRWVAGVLLQLVVWWPSVLIRARGRARREAVKGLWDGLRWLASSSHATARCSVGPARG